MRRKFISDTLRIFVSGLAFLAAAAAFLVGERYLLEILWRCDPWVWVVTGAAILLCISVVVAWVTP